MKFAHMADCHLGGWSDPELTEMGLQAFTRTINTCIDENVDFVLISGDIFDTGRPSVDVADHAVKQLKKLKDNGIRTYFVPGSHDFSPTGKTMLNIIDSSGLMARVDRASSGEGLRLVFTEDKTGAKLVGMPGRKGSLEENYYKDINRKELEDEDGLKIFLFHSAIDEFKPKGLEQMKALPLSLLPKGFNYYAGGHVHRPNIFKDENYGTIGFPGALFPNNFKDMEKFGHGGFFIVEYIDGKIKTTRKNIEIAEVVKIDQDAENKTPEEVDSEIRRKINNLDIKDKIILLRIAGTMKNGSIVDIGLRKISLLLKDRGAKVVKRNTNKLSTREYEEIIVDESSSKEELEDRLINETHEKHELDDIETKSVTKQLMSILSSEKKDGERNDDYQARVFNEISKVLRLDKVEDLL